MNCIRMQSIANQYDILTIGSVPGHDMWIKTERIGPDEDSCKFGQTVRIYSWAGSQNFGPLYDRFYKTLSAKADINKNILRINEEALDLESFEKVELIDDVADKSVLAVYRNQMGHIGIQTMHVERDDIADGPIVWMCADKEQDASRAMKNRRRIFAPIFDLTQTLAKSFNQHTPI